MASVYIAGGLSALWVKPRSGFLLGGLLLFQSTLGNTL